MDDRMVGPGGRLLLARLAGDALAWTTHEACRPPGTAAHLGALSDSPPGEERDCRAVGSGASRISAGVRGYALGWCPTIWVY